MPDQHVGELEHTLSLLGLDLKRYSASRTAEFLARWSRPRDWPSREAQGALLSTFTIGETAFMRHPEQFVALRTLLLSLCRTRSGAPLRAFSAGCASGEEAYSLAAVLSEVVGNGFELVAWDLNPDAIARARNANYRPWSLRGVSAASTVGWLDAEPCGARVQEWLRKRVVFQVGNLYLDPYPTNLDIVFCRNVLLYFRPEAAARVLARISVSLRPSGLLFLGPCDPTPDLNLGLAATVVDGVTCYRKIEQRSEAGALCSQELEALSLPCAEDKVGMVFDDRAGYEKRMMGARMLANERRFEQALMALEKLGVEVPLRPDVHVLTALVAEDAGEVRLMLEAARRACLLVPNLPAPNYFLSVAFLRNGEMRRAAVHRRIAASALGGGTVDAGVVADFSEGLTVGQLRRLIGATAR